MTRLVVIGGGIAGLSAAHAALKNWPDAQVSLLEAGPSWGGKIVSERVLSEQGEFVVEGGPDSFLAGKPYALALCDELGLSARLVGTLPVRRSTHILHHGRLLPLPEGLSMLIPTDFGSILGSGLLSWRGKMRLGLDFVRPAGRAALNAGPDETLGAFISRRLGREAYDSLIEPLMSGIYAGDGDALSLQSTFPQLRALEMEYGSLARGALEMRRKALANGQAARGSRSTFLTTESGLAELVMALQAWLDAHGVVLRLNSAVSRVARRAGGYGLDLADGSTLDAQAVILATPPFVSAGLLAGLDPLLAADLRAIPYVSTATISLAYRLADLPQVPDGYGYVIPRREGRRALACTWTSSKFPGRAPAGGALMRVFVGRAGQDILSCSQSELLAVARDELARTLGITADPLFSRVFIWEQAMPQYNLGHLERLARIDAALAGHPGLALAGNGYKGIGIPDCIHSGELAAGSVLSPGLSGRSGARDGIAASAQTAPDRRLQ